MGQQFRHTPTTLHLHTPSPVTARLYSTLNTCMLSLTAKAVDFALVVSTLNCRFNRQVRFWCTLIIPRVFQGSDAIALSLHVHYLGSFCHCDLKVRVPSFIVLDGFCLAKHLGAQYQTLETKTRTTLKPNETFNIFHLRLE